MGAGRDALGPEVARRLRGEMDHETVRINMVRAAALVHPPVTIDDLEFEVLHHENASGPLAHLASAEIVLCFV